MPDLLHTHSSLVDMAESFLQKFNCKVVIKDPFRAITPTGEQPDAIGWKGGCTFLIEVKVSRSDFLADRKKQFRANPLEGMGDWRFYLCPEGVIGVDDLPCGWGLLWVVKGRVKKVHGLPRGNCVELTDRPFTGNRDAEAAMLVSALRRLSLRGHLPDIYDSPFKSPVVAVNA